MTNELFSGLVSASKKVFSVDHQGTFNDPGKLTKEKYLVSYAYTSAVNEWMVDVINYVSKMDEQALSWFKESFHIADFRELLGETIKK